MLQIMTDIKKPKFHYICNVGNDFIKEKYVFSGWSSVDKKLLCESSAAVGGLLNNTFHSVHNDHKRLCIITPYMLKQYQSEACHIQQISKRHHLLLKRITPTVYHRYAITLQVDSNKSDYDLYKYRKSGDRLTYVVHYLTHHSLFFKHFKAIQSLNHYWKDTNYFSTSNSDSRAIWIGNVWYENKPLYLFQPRTRLGPFSNIFHLFVRSVWYLWSYENSKNIDTAARTWKVYYYLRKAWQLEVYSRSRINGRRQSRRRFLRKVQKCYSAATKVNSNKERQLLHRHYNRIISHSLSSLTSRSNKVANQASLCSYIVSDVNQLDNTNLVLDFFFYKQIYFYFFLPNYLRSLLKLKIATHIWDVETTIFFNRLIISTLYYEFNFNRPRQSQWSNEFLSPKYKFTGNNIPKVQNKFMVLPSDLFWIHTYYPNGRSPFNYCFLKNKLVKHSFRFRVRSTGRVKPFLLLDDTFSRKHLLNTNTIYL